MVDQCLLIYYEFVDIYTLHVYEIEIILVKFRLIEPAAGLVYTSVQVDFCLTCIASAVHSRLHIKQYYTNTVKNDLLKIRKNLLTPTSAKMLLFQDVFLLILVCPTTN